MTRRPRVLIVLFPGTNCHHELADAFWLAGGHAIIVPVKDLISGKVKLYDTDIIAFAGGFSYGDHVRSGAVAAHMLLTVLRDQFFEAIARRIPMIGICNGFQILVETGLLPGDGKIGKPTAVLDMNTSGTFVHRRKVPVCFRNPPGMKSVWLNEVNGMCIDMIVGHGEGRLDPQMSRAYQVAGTYGTEPGGDVRVSPNGSVIAALCSTNADLDILGLMPHPERSSDKIHDDTNGLLIFRSAVKAVR